MRTLKLSDWAQDVLVTIVLVAMTLVVGACIGATIFLLGRR